MKSTVRICASLRHGSLVLAVFALLGASTGCSGDSGEVADTEGTSVPAVDAANDDAADDAGGLEPGADCASNSGLSGTVVDSQSQCASREAFCEPMTDGYYCTGYEPFTCLPGQVRVAQDACESPLLVPGQATSATSVPSVDAATDAAADAGGIQPGADCTSSSGLAGTVVDGPSKCADDAFCEQLSNGHYSTG